MKEITLNNKNYLLVEVPDDAHDFYINDIGCIRYSIGSMSSVIEPIKIGKYLEKDNDKLIGKISDILKDEEICKGLVENIEFGDKEIYYKLLYNNYIANCRDYRDIIDAAYEKATDSFLSYLQSIDLDLNKNYLLIEKL